MLEFIVPAVDEQMPVFDRADRILPLVASFQHTALHNATAGKTQEARVQIRKQLHHVGAQSSRTV